LSLPGSAEGDLFRRNCSWIHRWVWYRKGSMQAEKAGFTEGKRESAQRWINRRERPHIHFHSRTVRSVCNFAWLNPKNCSNLFTNYSHLRRLLAASGWRLETEQKPDKKKSELYFW